jgi:hypothetical protein
VMLARAEVELPLAAEAVWQLAKKTATQLYLSRQAFTAADDLPAIRAEGYEGAYRVRLLGVIPAWTHHQRVERLDDRRRELVFEEWGGPYRRWTHCMAVEEIDAGRCRFRDSIEVSAGLLTPVVWLAARSLCRSRMRRLRELGALLG